MRIIDNMHVLLLKGGYGSEREVSLKSAEACSKAIKENGPVSYTHLTLPTTPYV